VTTFVQGTDNLGKPPIYISELDLADEDIQLCIELLGLNEVLHQIGFCKEAEFGSGLFYETEECTHRSLSGKVHTGIRYSGLERIDKDWILNGNPSEQAKDLSRKDKSYIDEIRKLGKVLK
jgi:hypothetical protein